MLEARPYQKIAIASTIKNLLIFKNTMLIAPTGAGKTFMLSKIINELLLRIGNKKRVLVLVHRNKINEQNKSAFEKLSGRTTGLFISGHINLGCQVTFGMVQTIGNYIDKLPSYDLLVIDEFHHAMASTYVNIIENQKQQAKTLNKDFYLFGATATPNRSDNKNLGSIVSNYSCQITIQELIKLGYLVPPVIKSVNLFSQRNIISNSNYFHRSAIELVSQLEELKRNKIIIFASNIKQIKFLESYLKKENINSVSIHNEKTKTEIYENQKKFETGKANVLLNVDIATEGYDFQPIDCVVLMRAIGEESKGLLLQMVGRGLRAIDYKKYPNTFKKDCLVLDFGGNFEVHKNLDIEPDLEDVNIKPAKIEISNKRQNNESKDKEIDFIYYESTKLLYESGLLESFNYKDKFIQGVCGINKSLFILDNKIFFITGANITLIEERELDKKIKEVLESDIKYLTELKNTPIEEYQINLLIDKFDLIGCSKYKASTLISFLAHENILNQYLQNS